MGKQKKGGSGGSLGKAIANVRVASLSKNFREYTVACDVLEGGEGNISATQAVDVEEFLATSLAAQTSFGVDRYSSRVICLDADSKALNKHLLHKELPGGPQVPAVYRSLPIPRRPISIRSGEAFVRESTRASQLDKAKHVPLTSHEKRLLHFKERTEARRIKMAAKRRGTAVQGLKGKRVQAVQTDPESDEDFEEASRQELASQDSGEQSESESEAESGGESERENEEEREEESEEESDEANKENRQKNRKENSEKHIRENNQEKNIEGADHFAFLYNKKEQSCEKPRKVDSSKKVSSKIEDDLKKDTNPPAVNQRTSGINLEDTFCPTPKTTKYIDEDKILSVPLKSLTAEQLAEIEGDAFLTWRRKMASIEEEEHLTLTPYERNINYWRQLWKVVELSDLVAQILDARNPSLFVSLDLPKYTQEVSPHKQSLIILNKADFLSKHFRTKWAKYFQQQNLGVVYFSAVRELEAQGIASGLPYNLGVEDPVLCEDSEEIGGDGCINGVSGQNRDENGEENNSKENYERSARLMNAPIFDDRFPGMSNGSFVYSTKVLNCEELIRVFETFEKTGVKDNANGEIKGDMGGDFMGDEIIEDNKKSYIVGMVGYPNVGKSSLINALYGAKKLSVSRQPGKTKHYQTLLVPRPQSVFPITLCDCPGLVFPSVVATKHDLLINAVLPIDHFRGDYLPAIGTICERLALSLCCTYKIRPAEVGLDLSNRTLDDFKSKNLKQKWWGSYVPYSIYDIYTGGLIGADIMFA